MADFNFSLFGPEAGAHADGSVLVELLDVALREGQAHRWETGGDGLWRAASPVDLTRRKQGWKLHVSATAVSAEEVLVRCLAVLLGGDSPFKFARTPSYAGMLNARHTSRGHSGKFITVYPSGDEEAVRLAAELHAATAGLAGPRVLSDRPYVPGSLVHYRYGAFVEQRTITNDGFYAWVMYDPDGNPVEDRRLGHYAPPPWVRCPFPAPPRAQPSASGQSAGRRASDGSVLIQDRFLVREAIRHANKGGVYRATDTDTGGEAVIKEARPHVGADEHGRDVRDQLRHEAEMLRLVEALDVAPRVLLTFEQGGHLFLAEDHIPGVPLRQWVPDRIRAGGWRRHVPGARNTADRLAALMERVHEAGLVVRDFNPNNIMVLPDGDVRLIDLELAVPDSERSGAPGRVGTLGYSAPEQLAGNPADVAADYYSLGATICFVLTGNCPYFLEDSPPARPLRDRLAEWLAVRDDERVSGRPGEIPAEAILGLMDDHPARRETAAGVRPALAGTGAPASEPARRPGSPRTSPSGGSTGDAVAVSGARWREVVDGTLHHLLTSMDPDNDERLWPTSCANGAPDPCCLQHGAAGVLRVLAECFELTGDERLPQAITAASGWIDRRLRAGTRRPPGLYFGEAGMAWSIYEAGRALSDHKLRDRGTEIARSLPATWSNPDMTHGTAGIGLTSLHFWLRTGDREFVERAGESADALLASADDGPDGLTWAAPAELDSRLAGLRNFGYAHGTAGVGCFLLAFALATGRSDCLALARRAGETLLAGATVTEGAEAGEGAALWGVGPGAETTAPYWCHGSSGIGAYLVRLSAATGDDRFGKVADMAAQAVSENASRAPIGQCHGLAGNGGFLLDMARAAGGGTRDGYVAEAERLARILVAGRAYRDGRMVLPDEQGEISSSWGDGLSGVLAFFLRLRYGSPRLWTVEPPGAGHGLAEGKSL